jgi:bifunctional non-homologous end joining protein LigD
MKKTEKKATSQIFFEELKPLNAVSSKNSGELIIEKKAVKFTNLDKVYFPTDKVSKGDVIAYYQSMADYILPYLKGRPQSLLRNPNGIADKGFYHKDAGDEAPSWAKKKIIYSESAKKDIDYLICNDKPTLAYMNNLGCIELNPWHSRITSLDKPDYLAIDLDPSPKNTFEQVIETALVVKEVFDKAGVVSFCKTSGASGLHIYVPLNARYDYEEVKNFANIVAIIASEQLPGFTSVVRPLDKRGDNIYIDYLQNRRGQTLASVYSLRPREGAAVSTPLQWKEVKKGLQPTDFTIFNIHQRLKKTSDLFTGVLGKGIDLEKCLEKL